MSHCCTEVAPLTFSETRQYWFESFRTRGIERTRTVTDGLSWSDRYCAGRSVVTFPATTASFPFRALYTTPQMLRELRQARNCACSCATSGWDSPRFASSGWTAPSTRADTCAQACWGPAPAVACKATTAILVLASGMRIPDFGQRHFGMRTEAKASPLRQLESIAPGRNKSLSAGD